MRLAYLNDPALKTALLVEIGKHEAADALVKGRYGNDQCGAAFRGCGIGCSLHSLNIIQKKTGAAEVQDVGRHARFEAELGLPMWFAYMEDHVFERLPDELSKTWPRRLAEAVPVGAAVDDIVLAKILRWSLADPEFGVRHATDEAEVIGVIDGVIAGFDAEISTGGLATAEQREAAALAARDAWATRAAWDAWATRAAWDAWAARDAWATRAAWDAWATRAAWDAWDAWAARDAARNAGSGTPVASRKAAQFYPALSEFVLATVRALPITVDTALMGAEMRQAKRKRR